MANISLIKNKIYFYQPTSQYIDYNYVIKLKYIDRFLENLDLYLFKDIGTGLYTGLLIKGNLSNYFIDKIPDNINSFHSPEIDKIKKNRITNSAQYFHINPFGLFRFTNEYYVAEYIPFRNLIKTIDKTNYFIKTKAYFKFIADGNKAENLWEKLKRKYGNEHISESGSRYIIDDNNGIYRYADHWGDVASCDWYLKKNKPVFDPEIFIPAKNSLLKYYSIGYAKFKDFRINNNNTWKEGSFIENPEWIKIMEKIVFYTKKNIKTFQKKYTIISKEAKKEFDNYLKRLKKIEEKIKYRKKKKYLQPYLSGTTNYSNEIYVDGTDISAGLYYNDDSYYFPRKYKTTNNDNEILSILIGVKFAVYNKISNAIIYTDSQIAEMIISKNWSKKEHLRKKAWIINKMMDAAKEKGLNIRITWISGKDNLADKSSRGKGTVGWNEDFMQVNLDYINSMGEIESDTDFEKETKELLKLIEKLNT